MNNYKLTPTSNEEHRSKIERVANQLYEEKPEGTIGYERFCLNYMKLPLPETELEIRDWKDVRSTVWCNQINNYFLENGLDCKLFTERDEGLKLEFGANSVKRTEIDEFMKDLNRAETGIKRAKKMLDSGAYPQYNGTLTMMLMLHKTLKAIIGANLELPNGKQQKMLF